MVVLNFVAIEKSVSPACTMYVVEFVAVVVFVETFAPCAETARIADNSASRANVCGSIRAL